MKISRNKDTGNFLTRYVKSFFHAIYGIIYAILNEHNMIIILLAVLVTTAAGFYFQIRTYEWLFCILSFGLVSASEMINTAIEATIDLVTSEIHPLAKIAKDTASSATLILCITALIGAILIFVPYIQAMV
jgi:undecaprenol kinase